MPNCPNCKDPIEGFVTRDLMETKIKEVTDAKNKELNLSNARIKELSEKASGFDVIKSERDEFKGKFETLVQKQERSEVLAQAGISADKQDTFLVMFNSHNAGKEEPESLADWLEGTAKSHPLLSMAFGAESPSTERPLQKKIEVPNVDANTQDVPLKTSRPTYQDVMDEVGILQDIPLTEKGIEEARNSLGDWRNNLA